MLKINFTDAVPIWKQIEDEMRRLIASEKLLPGHPVPSVRELAKELRINPATVAKAYQSLVDERLLQVKRGDGTYVADELPSISRSERQKHLRQGATRYASVALQFGADLDAATAELESSYKKLTPKGDRS